MQRAGGNSSRVILESMICREAFAFGAASDIVQADRNEINGVTYEPAQYTFTPTESGNYQLAFRYNANIVQSSGVTEEQFSIYLDHIGLFENERHDLELAYVDIPVEAQMGQRNVLIKCGYRNFGETIEVSRLKFYYRIGDQAVVAESALRKIEEGGIGQHSFDTPADFSRDTLNEVRIWAQDGNQVITDTFKVTIRSLKSHYPPYRDLLTEETKEEWRISSLAAEPSWQFVREGVYDAPYAVRTTASDGVLAEYLVMPPIQMQKDTVYLIAFYAKSSQERADAAQAGLSLAYSTKGYGVADFDRNIGRVETLTTEYKPYYFYFKAQESGPVFIALHSQLQAYSGSNWIDHIVVMDSVSASYSYMALTDVAYRRVTGCDEDRTTEVELEIRNDGYLAYDSVPILYQMDDLSVQTYWLENGSADMSSRRFKLPERWDLSKAGNHRMRVWVGMPNERDRSNDTLAVAFRADDMARLPLGYDFENNVLPGNVEDRNGDRISWELRRNADSAYDGRYYVRYQGTGQASADDWKLPCFYADADEYTLDFYMSAPYASEELLEIYLLHYDETDTAGQMIQELLLDTVVAHTDYRLYQLPFRVGAGHYGLMFRIKSEADGRTLCIDNLTIADYGLKDVALTAILSPAEADTYDAPLDVTVRLRNNGRVTIHDVPLVLTINGEEVQRVEVPTMEGNVEMTYTFPDPIDLHEPGTYRIAVSAEWVLDQRPGNNRQEITRVQGAESDLSLTVLTEPMAGRKPYGREETLSVRIENRGRTTANDVPIEAVVNGSRHLNGILPAVRAGEAIVYTFDQTVDMSDSAWYEFVICLSPATPDNNPLNDTLYSRIDGRYPKTANEDGMMAVVRLVYPNPARTVLYVEVPGGFTHLEIYSLQGRRYLNRPVTGVRRYEIPVTDYPEGVYVLKLSGEAGEKTVKWIKAQ
ncbi:MAG: T9SS type A sorting domain-containing protein [Bacteroidales bacterium]|nr:T9SS type A sorting domain-containing protein [Bacteroidales bacterium]